MNNLFFFSLLKSRWLREFNSLKQVPAVHIPPVKLTQNDHIQLSFWTMSHSFAILKGIRDNISWISTDCRDAGVWFY